MADRSGRTGKQDLTSDSPAMVRNVCLVGPAGGGKTTLLESLLLTGGAIPRAGSVEDGTTVSDAEEGERAHGRSLSLAVAPLVHDGTKINFIDTPG